MAKFLETLGVSINPQDHGVSPEEWHSLVDTSFEGERGLNFIGTREKFHASAETLGIK